MSDRNRKRQQYPEITHFSPFSFADLPFPRSVRRQGFESMGWNKEFKPADIQSCRESPPSRPEIGDNVEVEEQANCSLACATQIEALHVAQVLEPTMPRQYRPVMEYEGGIQPPLEADSKLHDIGAEKNGISIAVHAPAMAELCW